MRTYDMGDMLAYSRGVREATDLATIQKLITGCVAVTKTNEQTDRAGIDYIALLEQGAKVGIDGKTRKPGCSRYWRNGPELALETWSVKPRNGLGGKVGWTLNQTTNVDYILFTYPPEDCDQVFLYAFQYLRMAFHRNLFSWQTGRYQIGSQDSGRWQSECIFVPESVVWEAVSEIRKGQQVNADTPALQHMPPKIQMPKTKNDSGYTQEGLFDDRH